MKVVCRESCFYSKELQRYDEGKIYDMNQEQLKKLKAADMSKYFTDEQGESLALALEPKKAMAAAPADKSEQKGR